MHNLTLQKQHACSQTIALCVAIYVVVYQIMCIAGPGLITTKNIAT